MAVKRSRSGLSRFLDGQLLVAMPGMTDPRFERAVICLCAHSDEGAMGIRINQAVPQVTFGDILEKLDIVGEDHAGLPEGTEAILVHNGGPVESGRGFVLHSADYVSEKSTLLIDEDLCLTATMEILRAIVAGEGPRRALLALGYAGWGPGQLENEIQQNGWLLCPAPADLVFDRSLAGKYERALAQIGVDPTMLSADAGHA
ncbi:MAG: YqgE/AlgH family protein [Bauldia sp.]|nr:YqgE/AlgH family protein [Bauldia sp.]